MSALRFLARDARDALGQVRSRLGPDAVVLSVAQVPAEGFSRFWRRPQIEVVASLPEPAPDGAGNCQRRAAPLWPRVAGMSDAISIPGLANEFPEAATMRGFAPGAAASADTAPGRWRSAAVLRQMGLLALPVEKVLARARSSCGGDPPASFPEELALVQSALKSFWPSTPAPAHRFPQIHVFIGPPGSGKTTVLCKWMAKAILTEERTACAWRLDGRAANLPGLLDLYGEILGVPVQREWPGTHGVANFDLGWVDLPGVDIMDARKVEELRARLEAMASAQIHLVLNAAYEIPVTIEQIRGFASMPVTDIIFTHLDEERRRGKLWNVVLGTNFRVGYLGGGQNIPGDFCAASPEMLISRQIGR